MKKNAPESTIVDTRSVKKFNGYSLYPREHFLSTNDNNRSLDSGLTNCYLDALSTDINLQVDETDIEWTFLTTESDRKEVRFTQNLSHIINPYLHDSLSSTTEIFLISLSSSIHFTVIDTHSYRKQCMEQ